jgi:maleamate amidohydrolase
VSAAEVYAARGFGGRTGVGARPALVVVDYCYGFTDPASALACDADGGVRWTAVLLEAWRSRGLPVAFTTVVYDPASEATAAAFIAKAPALRTLARGSRWTEIDARLAPEATEPVLEKFFASAFFGTALVSWLAGAGADTVVVVGASTSGCVRATAVDALQHGYRVVVPSDAVADRAPAAHEGSLHDLDAKYADVMTSAELLAALPEGER